MSGAVTSASVALLLALLLVACDGTASTPTATPIAPSAPSPAPPAPPSLTATIIITNSGVSPKEVTVAAGGRVTFVNNDIQPHDIAGGVDPANPDCREIDAVGFLTPGQQRQTLPLPDIRTCDFHDHSFHSDRLNGRIMIR